MRLAHLALVGSRVPLSLKVFLLTLATLDDLGAIVIIAIFYTSNLSLVGLGLAGIAFAFLIGSQPAAHRPNRALYCSSALPCGCLC